MLSESSSIVSSDKEPVHEMANIVKNYGIEELIEYLGKKNLRIDDEDFAIFRKEKITGLAFLETTEEKFQSYDLKGDPATVLTNVIVNLKKSNIPKSNTGLVSVFVDNFNLFIEGKYSIEKAGNFDYQRNSYQLNQLYVDHGRLLLTVMKGRKIGSNPVIVGSRPPRNDSLWDRIQNQDFDVIVYDCIANKEKKVDMELGLSIADVVYSKDPGIVLMIASDGDYTPAINRGYPDPSGRSYTLEITDGETLAKWQDDEIMECFDSLELFEWWFRKEGLTIYLYFDNKTHLKKAKNWLESKHPDVKV
ncbi:13639_t:CDS:2 [Ambispora gerdemannii]|uniref:13639_t:CDS:1 n=1 Tax=Ambispora gerdemannii TaxID=144530 RepID=A0A9N9C5L3_9GLOM|nr:13639_t:CDS:2 [Ambispora gerdemannii]